MEDFPHAESIGLTDVTIDEQFWNSWLETNREVTLEYQYEQLESSGCLENFRRVADGKTGGFEGMWFADSDAYKWLEAASYVLAGEDSNRGDDRSNARRNELQNRVDETIDLVAGAQDEDGYLNTYFTLEEPEQRWTNLNMMHELYCAGHLIEAAVANYRSTGYRSLLDVATRFADHIDSRVDDEIDGSPGHQEIELALVKLARVTGEDRYVDLAKTFVDRRGRADRFEREFERVENIAGYDPDDGGIATDARGAFYEDGEYDGQYAQAHAPLSEQETIEGHAVRAVYFYTGVAAIAAETGDGDLVTRLETLWENMTRKRMYVTGGIGSSEHGERFTEDYDLPNKTAYAETCAAIGSLFWNQRLFELTGNAKYTDLIERTLYNGVLSGVSVDGTEFFYDNRLESSGDHHRRGWFDCACCPPNVTRLLASLEEYLYAASGDSLYVNQYIGSTVSTTVEDCAVELEQTSAFPWGEDVTIDVRTAEPTTFSLELRVPSWCSDATVRVNGEPISMNEDVLSSDDGEYVTIEREWDDDRVEATFAQSVVPMRTHPAVGENCGRVALTRGPLVYCLEGVDNDRPLDQYSLELDRGFDSRGGDEIGDSLEGVNGSDLVVIDCEATVPSLEPWDSEREPVRESGTPVEADIEAQPPLYQPDEDVRDETESVTAVPYFLWDNRAPGEMAVWIRGTSSNR
ncbi:beta-L-arabinofuranosidase domain-containing protein [Halostagnicola sp. A-GB9-2]|uniref:glycoside hydrolase family 127 protein n=1 Tax=Halostagnicola sp. A-GB9-2 TaxID=3048066 RepID=UPI0024BFFEB8|nr:beta-L-arabinofuranosidase domain-containing protein [Halostagnicola sp. A-GB9-2]MDJ1433668.1 glycoside hydrolase family 127 protein [Halostagnicola sp. A-GB9-2]